MRHEVAKSRSQLKREENERQAIGFRFAELNRGQIDQLPLDEETRAAIQTAAAAGRNTPGRRAKLHVATLLRDVPLEELREIMRRIESGEPIRAARRSRLVEPWIDALRSEEAKAIGELVALVPGLDIGRLRQLVRNVARAERRRTEAIAAATAPPGAVGTPSPQARVEAEARHGKAVRALRQYLTELRPGADVPPEAEG